MSNQIASMFASLGFKVDTTGLDSFNSKLREVRGDTVVAARNIGVLAEKLRSASSALDGVNTRLDRISVKRANQNIADSYRSVASNVKLVEKALASIQANQKGITKALGKIHASVKAGVPIWDSYRAGVRATRDELSAVNDRIREIRRNSNTRISFEEGRPNGGSGGGGGGSPRDRQGRGFGGRSEFSGGFFRSMLPAVALAGGLPSAGFAVKETVQAGRERIKMSNIMTASTKDSEEYGKAMAFVRSESNRLGQSTTEMGLGFAKVMQSVQGKLSLEKTQKIFTGFGELMTVMGNSADDQKGVYRAMTQMFSKGKIEAEEEGQMAERGLPMKELIKKAAMEVYKVDQKGYAKMRKAGAVKAEDVLPRVAELMSEMANKNNALAKALEQSSNKQQRFMNRLNDFAENIMTSGLDAFLGKVFELLTGIVDHVEYLGSAYKTTFKALNNFTNGNGLLITALTVVLGLLIRKRKTLITSGRAASTFLGSLKNLGGFISGVFNSRLMLLARRFIWVTALIEGIAFASDQITKKMSGEANWIDWLTMKFELLGLKIQTITMDARQSLQAFWYELTHFGEETFESAFYFGGKNYGTRDKWLIHKGEKPYQAPKPTESSILESKRKYDGVLNGTPRSGFTPPNRTTAQAINQPRPLSIYLNGELKYSTQIDDYSPSPSYNLHV